jgi:hypothetical protein
MYQNAPMTSASKVSAIDRANAIRSASAALLRDGPAPRAVRAYCGLLIDVRRHLIGSAPDVALQVLLDILSQHEALSDCRGLAAADQRQIVGELEKTFDALLPRLQSRVLSTLPPKIMRALKQNRRGIMRGLVEKIAPFLSETCRIRWNVLLATSVPRRPNPLLEVQQEDHLAARKILARSLRDADHYVALERAGGNQSGRSVMAALVFLEAGRPKEALDHLPEGGEVEHFYWTPDIEAKRPRKRVVEANIMAALGDHATAQDIRLLVFEEALSEAALHGYLRDLPDEIRAQAEEAAMEHALVYHDVRQALRFLVSWGRTDFAAKCIMDHATAWTRPDDWGAAGVVKRLATAEPTAATVLLRGLVRNAMMTGDPVYVRKMPGWLRHLERLSLVIKSRNDFITAGIATHASFVVDLANSRKMRRRV